MVSGYARGQRDGCCGTSVQGDTWPWAALDLMDYFMGDTQIPEGSSDFNTIARALRLSRSQF
eukprot:5413769-Alexandrium_andersonii.AAC.1